MPYSLRQGSCSIMVKSRWRTLWASKSVCQYVLCLASCSLPFHNHTAHATCQSRCKARKQCFCKASVFFKLFRETVFQEQSKHVRRKQFFGAWIFFAKPKFSSSYWGKQCFRSPSLSTYRFCVDWKQSRHVRRKQFFGAWKNVFLRSPISSHKGSHHKKNEPQRGFANFT